MLDQAETASAPPSHEAREGTAESAPAPRPKRDREATRRRILAAARDLFGRYGYDGVSVRMIASGADANVALVHRYFGSKAALFGEVLEGEYVITRVIAGEGDTRPLSRRLAEHFVRRIHRGPADPLPRIMDRSVGDPEVKQILREHTERLVVEPLVRQLAGPRARARATLAATLIMGGGPLRRVLGVDDLLPLDPDELTDQVTAMFEAALAPFE
ncbi:TetR/AcrR family transcriptional regulator [Actinomadura viridis]|uniref:AcrR family transcriptional regulator n=1 Tax=Actinomadura viridis TaxID=58110 RepID=A0A931DCG7_9ACTN|nr:TetR family transcriptional regulator [Actinomadura viridis]MBG6086319.1 AcrR family transcriptional regulator [Actinomadura viridis]